MRLRTSIILAATAAAALAVSGTASASPATGHGLGTSIHATGVRPGTIKHIGSSTGNLTLKATNAYADLSSDNWSGYATPQVSNGYGATFTTFTVPTGITCGSTDTASSYWAGLDGWGDNTVEQDGVEADCNGGSPSLYAWVETYPAYEEEITSETTGTAAPVEPGDSFSASVVEISPSEYSFSLDDETQHWSFAGDLDMPSGYTGEDLTSEVITEATTECPTPTTCAIMPLTNFGTVSYGDAFYFNGSGSGRLLRNLQHNQSGPVPERRGG
jgi:Peptidase A4 family